MGCEGVRKTLSLGLGRGSALMEGVALHLRECRECAAFAREMSGIRAELRNLPVRVIPSQLVTQLQVLASREHLRRVSRGTWRGLMHFWAAEIRLLFEISCGRLRSRWPAVCFPLCF